MAPGTYLILTLLVSPLLVRTGFICKTRYQGIPWRLLTCSPRIKMIRLHVYFLIACFFQGTLSEMIECVHTQDCIEKLTRWQVTVSLVFNQFSFLKLLSYFSYALFLRIKIKMKKMEKLVFQIWFVL